MYGSGKTVKTSQRVVEQFFNKIKHAAALQPAMTNSPPSVSSSSSHASIRIWLRANEIHALARYDGRRFATSLPQAQADQDGQWRIPAGSSGSLFCG
jgi:hypothetical protein